MLTKPQRYLKKCKLYYRPPYNWNYVQQFLMRRAIDGLEYCDGAYYGRSFNWHNCKGEFSLHHRAAESGFHLAISFNNTQHINAIVDNIRRILDLEVDSNTIDDHIKSVLGKANMQDSPFIEGLRLPGSASVFEAGVRAILGQQVSVVAAHKLLTQLVSTLGEGYQSEVDRPLHFLFPAPEAIANCSLDYLKMPAARKNTLREFARYHIDKPYSEPDSWLCIKGIGPWTIDYAKLRGQSNRDIFLAGDAGIKNALKQLKTPITPETASPWRSYLSLQLWNRLNGTA